MRLSEFQAALVRSQMERMDELLIRRRELAAAYADALAEVKALILPGEREGMRSAWHLYRVRVDPASSPRSRRQLYDLLHRAGIGVQVHYIPVHLQPYYRKRFGSAFGDHPVAEKAYLESLSLPLYPDMTEDQTFRVVDALRSALGGSRS